MRKLTTIEKFIQEIQIKSVKGFTKNEYPQAMYQETEAEILLALDGTSLYVIPKSLCYLDFSKINKYDYLTDFIAPDEQDTIITPTGYSLEYQSGNKKITVIELGNQNFKTYVNKKNLRPIR